MNLNNISLKSQFYIFIMGVVTVVMFSGIFYNLYFLYAYKISSFVHESELQADLIADNAVAPIMFSDADGLSNVLSQLSRYENILQVLVYTKDNKLFSSYVNGNISVDLIDNIKHIQFTNNKCFLNALNLSNPYYSTSFIIKHKISLDDEVFGTLYIQKDTIILTDFIKKAISSAVIFSVFLFLLTLFFVYKISKKLIVPIVDLSHKLTEISNIQDYSLRLKYNSKNEIGMLYSSFNGLFSSIEQHQKFRDQALEKAKSYQEHLKRAQNQLVESEKMAALGSLVSGVAHEVNTPLGNAVTGSTIIKSETQSLLKNMKSGTLKRSTLEESLSHIDETSRLLYKSVNTAADLIRSFKMISVDQSIEQKREFDIVEYIKEVIKTFHNKLKQIPVDVEVIAPNVLTINSYPGTFAQLLNNFIQNSIIHGFENKKDTAKIVVKLSIDDSKLVIVYSDNGAGMDEEMSLKAFEPFVTTKRNEGGTGLGLNIVYNLVTQKLKGAILLDTKLGEGVKITIILPI